MHTPERFYSLDVLRGIAALCVVFWHWQHFFYIGTTPIETLDVTRFPLFVWAHVLYTKGWLAVDLFFSLSGFVFYWLYSERIAKGTISTSRFALLRLSRLYPLHFATLLIVALGQIWLMNSLGSSFVYANNDSRHFILNLFFASSWGMERGYSFNGPIWSVSVEVLIYALFFAYCRLFPTRIIFLVGVSILGFVVVSKYYSPIGRGIGSFFLGGCIYLAYYAVITSHRADTIINLVTCLLVGAWAVTLANIWRARELTSLVIDSMPFLIRFDSHLQLSIGHMITAWPILVLFPLTILWLALFETRKGSLGKRISFLGDISYSSYVFHFPLQLLFSIVVARFAMSESIYYAPWFMALFFATLIAVSLGSFHYFERPTQKFLRRADRASRPTESGETRS